MRGIIREMIVQADDERNLDLITSIKGILEEFSWQCLSPIDWGDIGAELAEEYAEDSWVYENLELWNFVN